MDHRAARLVTCARHRPRGHGALGALLVLASSSGCDIVQGLSDAGGAIFPEDPTHVNAPGSRIAAGNFSDLDFAGVWLGKGTIGFKLLARSALPGDDSVSVIGFTDGRVCRVEHVGAYRVSTIAGSGEPLFSYLDGPGPRGTLRFVDADCQPLAPALPDAVLPSTTLADGRRIVVTGDDLVVVDLEAGSVETLESEVERVTTRPGGPQLVQAGGRLNVYDDDWTLIARHGQGVITGRYLPATGMVVLEDENGIWLGPPAATELSPLAPDGCGLGFSLWQPLFVTFRAPCEGGNAIALGLGTASTFDLGPDIDSRHVEFWTTGLVPRTLWVAHFRDFDEATSTGTLLLRSDDGRDVTLGERAAAEWIRPTASGTGGFALVNVEGEIGDLVRFDTAGAVQVLAERALRVNDESRMIVNFDGEVGDMGGIVGGAFTVLLSRVPRDDFFYLNRDFSAAAVLDDFDGRTGTLSRFYGDFSDLEPVATRVLHPHHGFVDSLFPGMAWIRAEGEGDTGVLEYRNDDLVFTATVSEGVASFLPTTEGLIYTVPHGAGAGVWFADAK